MDVSWIPGLAARISSLQGRHGRRIVAIVGPPGSGKSTCAEALEQALEKSGIPAAVVPMDGFHFDDAVLEARGLRHRKGAPETFDAAGLKALLTRLRRNKEPDIAIPVFDRSLELSRNAARVVPRSVEVLIVEGNYLLLNQPGWRELSGFFDLRIVLEVSAEELRLRLYQRWRDWGLADQDIPARVEGNDLPNGLTVLRDSFKADVCIHLDARQERTIEQRRP